MLYWHATQITGELVWGTDPMKLAQLVSKTVGTMEPLPSWVMQGAVVGIVGGQCTIDEKYALMKNQGLPIAGIWMQDWVGQYQFPEGTRLMWNW